MSTAPIKFTDEIRVLLANSPTIEELDAMAKAHPRTPDDVLCVDELWGMDPVEARRRIGCAKLILTSHNHGSLLGTKAGASNFVATLLRTLPKPHGPENKPEEEQWEDETSDE